MLQKSIWHWAVLCSLFALCILSLFNHLGDRPIVMWDEATYSNNAIDMYEHPSLLVVSTEGIPEIYNSKPPLVIWLEALSFNFFGLNEFALRFPSALMGLLTIIIVFRFCYKTLNNFNAGVLSALILISSKGYIYLHGTRTGDLDSTLVFFTTLYTLYFLKLLLFKEYTTKNIIIISSGILLAFLTKGTAAFFLLPFLFLLAVISKDRNILFTDKRWYLAGFSVVALIASYYIFREFAQPGYLKIVYKEEISRFGSDNYDWLEEPFDYYFQNFRNSRFTPYFTLLPITLLLPLFTKDKTIRQGWLMTIFISIGYFLLISISRTKVAWYDLVLYPFMALLFALLFISIQSLLSDRTKKIRFLKFTNEIILVLLFALILPTYKDVIASTKFDDSSEKMYDMEREGAYMKVIKDKFPAIKSYTVLKSVNNKDEHWDQIKFYQRIYKSKYGYTIKISDRLDLSNDTFILTAQQHFIDTITSSAMYNVVDSVGICKLYMNKMKVEH